MSSHHSPQSPHRSPVAAKRRESMGATGRFLNNGFRGLQEKFTPRETSGKPIILPEMVPIDRRIERRAEHITQMRVAHREVKELTNDTEQFMKFQSIFRKQGGITDGILRQTYYKVIKKMLNENNEGLTPNKPEKTSNPSRDKITSIPPPPLLNSNVDNSRAAENHAQLEARKHNNKAMTNQTPIEPHNPEMERITKPVGAINKILIAPAANSKIGETSSPTSVTSAFQITPEQFEAITSGDSLIELEDDSDDEMTSQNELDVSY